MTVTEAVFNIAPGLNPFLTSNSNGNFGFSRKRCHEMY